MRVLVCGSRSWKDAFPIWTILEGLQARCEMGSTRLIVMTGAAQGADRIADEWCWTRMDEERRDHLTFPAEWDRLGKRAGYVRNQRMLDEGKPDLVLAFRCQGESKGTDMMVELARKAGVATYVVSGAS